jgi:hypothetical protein
MTPCYKTYHKDDQGYQVLLLSTMKIQEDKKSKGKTYLKIDKIQSNFGLP